MFDYDYAEDDEDDALDALWERSADPFDDTLITDEQLRRLFSLLTGDGLDCELHIRPFGARIIWVWSERDKAGKTRYFEYEIDVPRRRPMDFTAAGRSSNPGYGFAAKRTAARARVIDAVLRAMGTALGISLAGHVPDPEMSRYFYENRRR